MQRVHHRVAALAVHLAHLLDLALPVVLGGYADTAIWLKDGGQSVADHGQYQLLRTTCGASAEPTRMPGENVFENDPR